MIINANKPSNMQPFSSYANYSALIADEFENSRKSVRQMLSSIGVGLIDQTANGKGVIDACRARKYDLVLCDFRLGNGKNGLQVLEELRQLQLLKSSAFFVIISAETSRDVVLGIMESEPDDYLGKPFTEELLSKRLERLFIQNHELAIIKKAMALKRFSEVVDLCEFHIESKGRYVSWCKRTLIDAYLALAEWDKLLGLCSDVLSERDLDWAMIGLIRMYFAKGDWNKAITEAQKTIKAFPQCVLAYDLLALCLEEKGQYLNAQEVLESAIKISPLRYERQQKMVEVSMENGDIQVAVKASQQALKFVSNTINEDPEYYFQLANILSEASLEFDGSDKKRMASDALSTLHKVSKKYTNDPLIRIKKTLVESQVHAHQGHTKLRDEMLFSAEKLIEQFPESKSAEISILLGKTLYLSGREEEAKQEWQELESRQILTLEESEEISGFLDEPIPTAIRGKAKALNAKGLKAYAQNDLNQAIELFNEAMVLSPRHPGLHMNFVQSVMKKIDMSAPDAKLLEECRLALKKIDHIGPNHKQYARYQKLIKLVAKSESL